MADAVSSFFPSERIRGLLLAMKSAWSESKSRAAVERWAAEDLPCNEDLALRVYSSRLIGREPGLVLHGGGNTSVKTSMRDDLGEQVDVVAVKGSGWDLGEIRPVGFPAVRLASLAALEGLGKMSDEDMVNAARTRLLDATAPTPSVELLLHAFLPHKFIDHSHADAILAIVDQPDATRLCAEVFGDTLAVVPFIMPGFQLAKRAAQIHRAHPNCHGLLLLHHGLFTFAETARGAYERHIAAVSCAEDFVASRGGPRFGTSRRADVTFSELAPTIRGCLGGGERRYVLTCRTSATIRAFVDRDDLGDLSQRGPATPDHVIRTKQRPALLDPAAASKSFSDHVDETFERYRAVYRAYAATQKAAKGVERQPIDPDPRIVLVPGLGIIAAGATMKAAAIAADIYEHTIGIIGAAEAVGTYCALGDGDIFDMEYWSLEQAKLGRRRPKPFEGRVVYITGAASGIGAETARRFAELGANLFLVDLDASRLAELSAEIGGRWEVVDVRSRAEVHASLRAAVDAFGGLDGVVSNAGTAPQASIDTCPPQLLEDSIAVNLLAHQWVASGAARILRAQGTGGFLLFNASKAAFNPGSGFGPYGVAKAGLIALMRQYALELGCFQIRSNAVNADRIRTGLLAEDDVVARASARGLEPDAYFRSNLLGREVRARDVADAFVTLALAERTTASVFTVDGGNIAAAPR